MMAEEEHVQPSNPFEKIPLWRASGKRFEIMSDPIDGRIPVTRLESWRQFTELLEDPFFNKTGVQLAFRGHRRYDWSLMPSLGRLTTAGIVSKAIADRQLEAFRRAVRGRLRDNFLVDDNQADELWSVGQHHGLLSPLLDWTYSPYVALFFAFAKEDRKEEIERDNAYRAIYVLNKTFVANDELCPDIRILEPRKDDHGRLVNQAGLFTFSPYDATIENKLTDILTAEDFGDEELKGADEGSQPEIFAKYICKIYIKNEEREACLKHLRRMNVHHASLFPDLIGAAQYCNIITTEEHVSSKILSAPMLAPALIAEPVEVSEHVEVVVQPASGHILDILKAPSEVMQVEPGRLEAIAAEISQEIEKNKVVDWDTRDAVQAHLRNLIRIILRKYGYPVAPRETVVDAILKLELGAGGDASA